HLETIYGDAASPLAEFREAMDSEADLVGLPEKLKECIAKTGQKEATSRKYLEEEIQTLREKLAAFERGATPVAKSAPTAPKLAMDAVTGLPLAAEVEAAIQRAAAGEAHAYAAVFYVHRMSLTNAKFGAAIGDQVLLFCSQHIATRLVRVNDLLFRWNG